MIHRRIGGIAAVLLLLSSCGETTVPQDPPNEEPSQSASFPVTLDAANGDVTIAEQPARIVSLSPTATEMLFAIGAGEQVEAVDDQSSYPGEAPVTDLSGFEPNVEAIASYEPDLVVYSTEPGNLGASLEGLGIPALWQDAAATLDDVYEQIDQLGLATGNVSESEVVVETMREEIESIAASIEPPDPPLTFFHELDDTYYSVTSSTFIGQLYSLVGLENIADAAEGAGGGYPQLSAEYIVDADPDLIFLADTKCCGQSPRTVSKRPGWDRIAAVQNGGVIPLDDDVASRWGPRVVDYLRRIAEAVADVLEAKAA
ncbi:MAG TPA: ABC transporter substrate-binding protein [Actinomycetota bacterium]|nr:ABC transporter substrate-binding protein [Actinomycetota bacterium]